MTRQVKKCCVPGCSNNSGKRHRFPKNDPDLFQKWLNAVNNPRFLEKDRDKIQRQYVLCEDHFEDEDKVPGLRGLRRFAVPTKHLPAPIHVEEKQIKPPQSTYFPKNLSKGFVPNNKPRLPLEGDYNYSIVTNLYQEKQHLQIEQHKKLYQEEQHSQVKQQKDVFQAKEQIEQPKKELEERTKQTATPARFFCISEKISKVIDELKNKPANDHDYSIIPKVNQEKPQSQNLQQKKGLVSVSENNNQHLEVSLPICIPNNLSELARLLLADQPMPTNKPITKDATAKYKVQQYKRYKNTIIVNGLTITEVDEIETNPMDCGESYETNLPQVNNLICRLCKCECREMTSLYSYDIFGDEQKQIIEIIEKCASVQISIDDALPQFACLKCLEELHRAFKFRKLCEKTNAQFKMELENKRKELLNTREMIEFENGQNEPAPTSDMVEFLENGQNELAPTSDIVEFLENLQNEPALTTDMVEFLEADIDASKEDASNDDNPKENGPFEPLLINGKVNKGVRRKNSVLFDVNNPIIQEIISSKNRQFILAKLTSNSKESSPKSTKISEQNKYGEQILRKTSKHIAEETLEYPQIENIIFNNAQFEVEFATNENDDQELSTVINELNTIINNGEFQEDIIEKHVPLISDMNSKKRKEIQNHSLSNALYTCELCENVYKDDTEFTDHLKTHIDTTERNEMSILYNELTKRIDKNVINKIKTVSNLTNSNPCRLCKHKSKECEHTANGKKCIESRLKPFLNFNKVIYKCCICRKKFKTKILLLEHSANIHNMKMYKCIACNINFTRLEQLKNHKKMNHISKKRIF